MTHTGALKWVYKGWVPDPLIRNGIRSLCKDRLKKESASSQEEQREKFMQVVEKLKKAPLAINTEEANQQHYEFPTDFYLKCLGKNLKYSGCIWENGCKGLDEAEDYTLEVYSQRAQLIDGQNVLELGCGWGSLTLFMAKKFPNSKITGVSNSSTQRTYIMEQAKARGLENIEILTCDINELRFQEETFDRIVSVEMFEHVRNYDQLFHNIYQWLKPEAKLFVHIFCHRENPYTFEIGEGNDWMAKRFFTGGVMPSEDLFLFFSAPLKIVNHWRVNGTHYEKTANAWLENLDKNQKEVEAILGRVFGKSKVKELLWDWRLFFMACAELWGYKNGSEWMVTHYLFEK